MSRFLVPLGPLAARLLLAGIFGYSGYLKLFAATGRTISSVAGKGIPYASTAAYGAGLFELLVALLLVLGLKTRPAALAALAYVIVVTWLFHWRPAVHGDVNQTIQVLKNAGIAGGMLLLASYGPGRASIDRG